MRADLAPGGTSPDYELPDHTRTPRRYSELQGDDPLILHARAPATAAQRGTSSIWSLARSTTEVTVAYTQIATISTDDHHTLQEFHASVGAQWTFLSNPERTVHGTSTF
jgi:peroxiredoxin